MNKERPWTRGPVDAWVGLLTEPYEGNRETDCQSKANMVLKYGRTKESLVWDGQKRSASLGSDEVYLYKRFADN